MRKLKLQVQMTIDGFVARPDGRLDWMWTESKPGDAVDSRVIELAKGCDTLLLGRKMTADFIAHWENIAQNQPDSPQHLLAQLMVNMRKIVFSRTQPVITGKNTEVQPADLVTTVQALKKEPGKDIIVYGGAGFVQALIKHRLIDEYYIFRNPVAIGTGISIFTEETRLKLVSSAANSMGKVLDKYLPV